MLIKPLQHHHVSNEDSTWSSLLTRKERITQTTSDCIEITITCATMYIHKTPILIFWGINLGCHGHLQVLYQTLASPPIVRSLNWLNMEHMICHQAGNSHKGKLRIPISKWIGHGGRQFFKFLYYNLIG